MEKRQRKRGFHQADKRTGRRENHCDGKPADRQAAGTGCPHFGTCGGCQYLSIPYAEQLTRKQRELDMLLSDYGKGEPIIGMDVPFHYRHKVHAVFHRNRSGEIISGVYEEGTHHVLPVSSCLIEHEEADRIINTIRRLLKSFKITIYHEDSGYGILRHVMVRCGYATGEIMVVLVTAGAFFPSKQNFAKALRKEHPNITTIVQNINDRHTSMVLGTRDIVIYGKGYIEDCLCGKRFRLSPQSFYQVNPAQTERLYEKAIDYAGLTGKETVLDAYCGIGTVGMIASSKAASVISVELNQQAVRDARINARLNQIPNLSIYENDAGKFMAGLANTGTTVDVVFMDPPRSGSDEKFLSSLIRLTPEKIVYISCGPETLARDLRYLTRTGKYVVKRFGAVDMFPMTGHVETIVLLSQRKADDYVEVELELDVTSAESKATYKEIQEYVLKEHGLKVSNLYISQVKRKCGIEVGENYNLPKSEDSRQPQCPEEKEKAIRDALEHFGMI